MCHHLAKGVSTLPIHMPLRRHGCWFARRMGSLVSGLFAVKVGWCDCFGCCFSRRFRLLIYCRIDAVIDFSLAVAGSLASRNNHQPATQDVAILIHLEVQVVFIVFFRPKLGVLISITENYLHQSRGSMLIACGMQWQPKTTNRATKGQCCPYDG